MQGMYCWYKSPSSRKHSYVSRTLRASCFVTTVSTLHSTPASRSIRRFRITRAWLGEPSGNGRSASCTAAHPSIETPARK